MAAAMETRNLEPLKQMLAVVPGVVVIFSCGVDVGPDRQNSSGHSLAPSAIGSIESGLYYTLGSRFCKTFVTPQRCSHHEDYCGHPASPVRAAQAAELDRP